VAGRTEASLGGKQSASSKVVWKTSLLPSHPHNKSRSKRARRIAFFEERLLLDERKLQTKKQRNSVFDGGFQRSVLVVHAYKRGQLRERRVRQKYGFWGAFVTSVLQKGHLMVVSDGLREDSQRRPQPAYQNEEAVAVRRFMWRYYNAVIVPRQSLHQ
jgi:hypothetical protein